MTEEHLHPGDGATADLAVTRAERTMARRVDGRFELAARNGGFATAIAMYAALTIAGAWLRTRLARRAGRPPPPGCWSLCWPGRGRG